MNRLSIVKEFQSGTLRELAISVSPFWGDCLDTRRFRLSVARGHVHLIRRGVRTTSRYQLEPLEFPTAQTGLPFLRHRTVPDEPDARCRGHMGAGRRTAQVSERSCSSPGFFESKISLTSRRARALLSPSPSIAVELWTSVTGGDPGEVVLDQVRSGTACRPRAAPSSRRGSAPTSGAARISRSMWPEKTMCGFRRTHLSPRVKGRPRSAVTRTADVHCQRGAAFDGEIFDL